MLDTAVLTPGQILVGDLQIAYSVPPVSGTESYSIGHRSRNPARSVETLLKLGSQGENPTDSALQITNTIVLEIVMELSRHEVWFASRDFHRCARSIRYMLHVLSSSSDDQSHMKYWLDRYMAVGGFQDKNKYPDPPEEFSICPFSGFFLRFIHRRVARRDRACLYSLQKGTKFAWPSRPIKDKVKAYQKHRKLICESHPCLSEGARESIEFSSHLVFSKKKPCLDKFLPTGKSCDNGKMHDRGHGGTRSLVSPLPDPQSETSKVSGCVISTTIPQLVNSFENHRKVEFRQCEKRLHDQIIDSGPDSIRHVSVFAIAEAAKFRLISKMDGNLANILQPLQGHMLNSWKETPFSTMLHEDLTERVQYILDRHRALQTNFGLWASGDYSSATDTLPLSSSQSALVGLESNPWYFWGSFSLLPSLVRYPAVMDETRQIVMDNSTNMQTSGQLMGHPLSFPLLCTINLSTYRYAVRNWVEQAWEDSDEYIRRKNLEPELLDLVIINGDDILFYCDQELYSCWLRSVEEHCFLPSPGKNYLSEDTAQINSQLFRISQEKVSRIGYLSQKMMNTLEIKQGGSAGPVECCSELNKLFALSPGRYENIVPYALNRFNSKFGGLKPNWYFPECLGGFGLKPWAKIHSTSLQRRYAAQFLSKPRPLYSSKIFRKNRKWLTFPRSSKRIVGDYCLEKNESDKPGNPIDGTLSTAGLWNCFDPHSLGEMAAAPVKRANYFRIERNFRPMKESKILDYFTSREVFLSERCRGFIPQQFYPAGARHSTVR